MQSDFYSLLGVNRRASQSDIARAYRSRVLAVHPDLNPNDHAAAEHLRKVIEAYQVLKDPFKRQQYDRPMPIPAPVFAPYRYREPACPLWVTRALLLMLFFVVSVGMVYAVAGVFTDNTMVFRPSAETILAAHDLSSSQTTLKAGDRSSGLHIYSLKAIPNPDPQASIIIH